MNRKPIWISFVVLGLLGSARTVFAESSSGKTGVVLPYDVADPSPRVAKRYQKKGDYVTAMLINEAILQRNPSDQEALKRMVECHDAMQKQDMSTSAAEMQAAKPDDQDGLTELPGFTQPPSALDSQIATNVR